MEEMKGHFCSKPFKNAEFHLNGEVFVCCPNWLNRSIGNISNTEIDDVWNSQKAIDIRTSILDGSYRYCNHLICPHIQSKNFPVPSEFKSSFEKIIDKKQVVLESLPSEIMLTYDLSCNLSCPSCRVEKISHSSDSLEYKQSMAFTEKIYKKFIENLGNNHLTLNITGSGDPFASLVFRKFIESLDGKKYPNLKIEFQTNGLLLTPMMWERLNNVRNNITRLLVSIDAATEETYLNVRRGGNWQLILENMKFLAQERKKYNIELLQANFVVQKNNYLEMEAFAKLFIGIGCTSVYFSLMNDWGTWSKEEFNKQLVWNENHSEFDSFITALQGNIFSHHKVYLGNLTAYRKLAIERRVRKGHYLNRIVSFVELKLRDILNRLWRKKFFLPNKVIKILKLILNNL